MKKFVQAFKGLASVLLVLAIGFSGGWYFRCVQEKDAQAVVSAKDDGFDLRLPGEAEERVVTRSEVEVQLKKISQLAVYSGDYTVVKDTENTRDLLDRVPIFGTTNTIHLECTGVVKVGFALEEITPVVENGARKIYISLPEPAVLDNYVIWDGVVCREGNNPLNPIDFEQYQTLIDEAEQEGLAQVEEKGIYEEAEENAKAVIREFLSGFVGYEVVFL